MSTVFEIEKKFYELQQSLEEGGDKDSLQLLLTELKAEREEKIEAIQYLIANAEVELAGVKEWQARFKAKRESVEGQIDSLKSLLSVLVPIGKKYKSNLGSIYWQKSYSVKIFQEDFIPDEYLIPQPPKVDKQRALRELKDGLSIEGMELEENESIRIRKTGTAKTE